MVAKCYLSTYRDSPQLSNSIATNYEIGVAHNTSTPVFNFALAVYCFVYRAPTDYELPHPKAALPLALFTFVRRVKPLAQP